MSWKAIKMILFGTVASCGATFPGTTRVGHHETRITFSFCLIYWRFFVFLFFVFLQKIPFMQMFPIRWYVQHGVFLFFLRLGFKQQVVFEAIYMIPVDNMLTERWIQHIAGCEDSIWKLLSSVFWRMWQVLSLFFVALPASWVAGFRNAQIVCEVTH